MDPNELIGLLGQAATSTASAQAMDARSSSDELMTQRMEADQFQALLQDSQASGSPRAQPSPPPPEPRAKTETPAISSTPEPEPDDAPRIARHPIDLKRPSAGATGVRILIGLLVVALVSALVGHTVIDAVVELVSQS
jgi:hypothetical protein